MEKNKLNILYTTTSKRTYPLEIGFSILKSTEVPTNKEITEKACREGCNLFGKNGGCPPFSPKFDKVCGSETILIYAKIDTTNYPTKVLNGPYYTRWVFVETFLTSLTNRIGIELSISLNGYFLSSGNCHGCRPKKCAVKEGKPCRNKAARTYSLESTGVLVVDAVKKAFGFELQWWVKDNPQFIPEYMVKCIGVTTSQEVTEINIGSMLEESLKDKRITIQLD